MASERAIRRKLRNPEFVRDVSDDGGDWGLQELAHLYRGWDSYANESDDFGIYEEINRPDIYGYYKFAAETTLALQPGVPLLKYTLSDEDKELLGQ